MKASGRLGLCTQVGGAVWAEQRGKRNVAVSLSGCGEYISKTLLAYKLASALLEWLVVPSGFFIALLIYF